eukprot:scaffold1365_cov163-Ochromonas_danica.AAC.23
MKEHSPSMKAKIALACAAHSNPVTKRLHHGAIGIILKQFPGENRRTVLRYWKQAREGRSHRLLGHQQ